MEAKNMEKDSAILVRIFKEEAEFEVWKEDRTGRFALLHSYPICRWSGDLGPKIKEGDRQAPEGFYPITPGQMNPNSNYYLAINTGFPNAYDRANGRTGDFLMIHGDCSSRGCYAMTDEQIGEIYALAREAFFGGQKAFQVQAFPFRMTPLNMARHRNSPHMAFWRMIKQGYDAFEVSHLEPKVDVCERHYVFNAESASKFVPTDRCPAYKTNEDIMSAVQDKQRRDDAQMAELISRGTPAAPAFSGVDGGMNPTFLTAVKLHGGPGAVIKTASGTIPAHVNPPADSPETTTGSFAGSFMSLASSDSRPAPAPRSQVASATTSAGNSGGSSGGIGSFFGNLFGSKSEDQSAVSQPPPQAGAPKSKPASAPRPTQTAAVRPKSEPAKTGPDKSAPESAKTANASTPPAAKPQDASSVQEANADASKSTGVMTGAAPTVPSGGFENRFGAWH
jgi:murein L,D-transpeptidase YafK